jgi:hypothetical protein
MWRCWLIAGIVSYLHMPALVALHVSQGGVQRRPPLSVDVMIAAATLPADSRTGRKGRALSCTIGA